MVRKGRAMNFSQYLFSGNMVSWWWSVQQNWLKLCGQLFQASISGTKEPQTRSGTKTDVIYLHSALLEVHREFPKRIICADWWWWSSITVNVENQKHQAPSQDGSQGWGVMEQLESCSLRWGPQWDGEGPDSLQDGGRCGHSSPEATIHISLGGVIR